MKYLLDTHVWIWFCEGNRTIPEKTLAILKDVKNVPLGISAISPWEVAKKASLEKLKLSIPVRDWTKYASENSGIEIVPLSSEISCESNFLPGIFHKDPADQIIVATTRIHEMTLITCDKRLLQYQYVNTLWA